MRRMRKTAIIYVSRRGITPEIAQRIGELLQDRETTLIDLDLEPEPDLSAFEEVILGGPLYMGELPERIRTFCSEHEGELAARRVGLFLSGLVDDPRQRQRELEKAYPEALRRRAIAMAFLGGGIVRKRPNLLERLLTLFMVRATKSEQRIDDDGIAEFCRKLDNN